MYTYLYSDLYFGKGNNSVEQKLHYLGIPLRVNWNFVDTRKFSVYLSAGGAIEKCVYGKLGDENRQWILYSFRFWVHWVPNIIYPGDGACI